MQKGKLLFAPVGAVFGLLSAFLAAALLKNLGDIALALSGIIGENTAQTLGAILGQIKGGNVMPPLLPAAGLGALLGWLWMKNGKKVVLKGIVLAVAFFLPCLWFTTVNGIMVSTAVRVFLKLVQAGMF